MEPNDIANAVHRSALDLATMTAKWLARDIITGIQHHDLDDRVTILKEANEVLVREIYRIRSELAIRKLEHDRATGQIADDSLIAASIDEYLAECHKRDGSIAWTGD